MISGAKIQLFFYICKLFAQKRIEQKYLCKNVNV